MHYQITDGVLAQTLGEQVVLFHPGTERLLTLNACGTRIWSLLTEETDAEQLVSQLADEFAGPEAIIQQQTLAFLAELEGEALIRRIATQ